MTSPTRRFLATRALALAALVTLYMALYAGQATVPQRDAGREFGAVKPNATEPESALRAVGDGTADDTAAIQSWVDAAGTSGGRLHFPPGAFRLTRTIVIDLDKLGPVSIRGEGTARLIMDGPGPALHLVGTHEGTAAPNTVKPNVWDRQRMPLVDGIEVVGRHAESCGVEITGTMQPTITRVTVRDALHGIHVTKRNRNVQISDCHIYDNRGVGIYLDGVNLHQINIVGCHVSYNDQGGIVCRDSEVRNLQIGTCDIEGNMPDGRGRATASAAAGAAQDTNASRGGSSATANVLLDCRSGSVREGAIVGCTIQHTRNAPHSANIRFLGQSPEVDLKVGNFCIADNVFSDVQVNVHLQFARGVTLTGNTFWQSFEANLLVENSSNIVVGPNLFDRNPDYRGEADGSTNAIVFRNCTDCTLQGLHVNNVLGTAAGVALQQCRWFNVSGCTILDCDGCGLELSRCEHVRVADCVIRDARAAAKDPVAIRVIGGNEVQVEGNLVAGRVARE